MKKRLVVLSGAGISAESGIKTFRDMEGLWNQYDITEVASMQAWEKNKKLVLNFYNERRKQLLEVQPNKAHFLLAELEKKFIVDIITQNVDDLHERAGSSQIIHLHGELRKVRSTIDKNLIYTLDGWELKENDVCEKGSPLRPHIVWFGEEVPMIEEAIKITQQADIFLVVGTSLNVYPAAGLLNYVNKEIPIFLIDPNEINTYHNITIIKEKASIGVQKFIDILKNNVY